MIVKIKEYTFNVEGDAVFWNKIDTWEQHSFNIMDIFLNKHNILIDVGAWNGVLTMYGSRLAKYVHSFEPDPVAHSKIVMIR